VREAADILQRQRDLLPLPAYDVRPVDVAAAGPHGGGLADVRLAPGGGRAGAQRHARGVRPARRAQLLRGRRALRRAIVTAQVPAFNLEASAAGPQPSRVP
jgi:hypothetical protein